MNSLCWAMSVATRYYLRLDNRYLNTYWQSVFVKGGAGGGPAAANMYSNSYCNTYSYLYSCDIFGVGGWSNTYSQLNTYPQYLFEYIFIGVRTPKQYLLLTNAYCSPIFIAHQYLLLGVFPGAVGCGYCKQSQCKTKAGGWLGDGWVVAPGNLQRLRV